MDFLVITSGKLRVLLKTRVRLMGIRSMRSVNVLLTNKVVRLPADHCSSRESFRYHLATSSLGEMWSESWYSMMHSSLMGFGDLISTLSGTKRCLTLNALLTEKRKN